MTTESNPLVAIDLKTLLHLAAPASGLPKLRHRHQTPHSGLYLSPQKGRGMVFDETRLYQAGDDVRHIDWRVTARTAKPHSKLFREERETPLLITVDYRTNMRFATRGVFKSVQAAKLAGLLAWSALQRGDRIGGHIFTDQGYQLIKPQSGKAAMLHFFQALVAPRLHLAATPQLSLAEHLQRLRRHAHPGTHIGLISDFRGLDRETEHQLTELSRHCSVLLLHVYDPLEAELPKQGEYRFTDGLHDRLINTSNIQTRTQHHLRFQQHQQHLQQLCRKLGMSWLTCRTDASAAAVLRLMRQH